jgi:transcriptional regulator with XRE-family HTH domain
MAPPLRHTYRSVQLRPEEQRIVGECLAKVRARAGITQRNLAARLDKPQSFVSAYENGQRRIDLLEFLAILEALGADPRAVFGEIIVRRARQAKHPRSAVSAG